MRGTWQKSWRRKVRPAIHQAVTCRVMPPAWAKRPDTRRQPLLSPLLSEPDRRERLWILGPPGPNYSLRALRGPFSRDPWVTHPHPAPLGLQEREPGAAPFSKHSPPAGACLPQATGQPDGRVRPEGRPCPAAAPPRPGTAGTWVQRRQRRSRFSGPRLDCCADGPAEAPPVGSCPRPGLPHVAQLNHRSEG